MQLPVDLEVNEPVAIALSIADDLARWDVVGRVHEVLLRVRVIETTELDRYRFKLNARELPDRLLRKINRMYSMSAPRYRVRGYWYVFRLDREHWPVKGTNSLEVTLLERDPPWRLDKTHPQNILLGGGCHGLDLMLWVMQDVPVAEVFARELCVKVSSTSVTKSPLSWKICWESSTPEATDGRVR